MNLIFLIQFFTYHSNKSLGHILFQWMNFYLVLAFVDNQDSFNKFHLALAFILIHILLDHIRIRVVWFLIDIKDNFNTYHLWLWFSWFCIDLDHRLIPNLLSRFQVTTFFNNLGNLYIYHFLLTFILVSIYHLRI